MSIFKIYKISYSHLLNREFLFEKSFKLVAKENNLSEIKMKFQNKYATEIYNRDFYFLKIRKPPIFYMVPVTLLENKN